MLKSVGKFMRREFAPLDMADEAGEPEAAPEMIISERMAEIAARDKAAESIAQPEQNAAQSAAYAFAAGGSVHLKRRRRGCGRFMSVHPALLALVLFALALGQGRLIALTVAVLALHEAGHIACARMLSVPVSRLRVTPLGAALELDGRLISPRQEAIIAAAGPCMSALTVAVLCLLTGRGMDDALLRDGAGIALALTLFNLIPASPLDGGRMLHALLRARLGERRAGDVCGGLGMFMAFLLMLCVLWSALGGVVPVMLLAASVCVFVLAADEFLGDAQTAWQLVWSHRDELAGGACLPVRVLAVDGDTPARLLLGCLRRGVSTRFRVVDEKMRCLGEIDEAELVSRCVDSPGLSARGLIAP